MSRKFHLSGFGGFGALAITALLASPSLADVLTGKVYQVSGGDAYITMEDSTVARVPLETAQFRVDGVLVPANSLSVGQQVVVDYTPVYGFQRFYHTSAGSESPTTVYIIQDISPDDTAVVEWDGRVYRLQPLP